MHSNWPRPSTAPQHQRRGAIKSRLAAKAPSGVGALVGGTVNIRKRRQRRRTRTDPGDARELKDGNRLPGCAPEGSSGASPLGVRAAVESDQLTPARFPCAAPPMQQPFFYFAFCCSRSVFSKISSTAFSRGRPAAFLLAMISVKPRHPHLVSIEAHSRCPRPEAVK